MIMRDERINICYGISDKSGNYAKIMGTSICSLLENTDSPVTLHILHDKTLTEDNYKKIKNMVEKYRQMVCFHDVSEIWKDTWGEVEKMIAGYGEFRFTIGTFFRLLMGEWLKKEKRIIYLDADTIVNMDIKELWENYIPPSGMAAVTDVVIQNNMYYTVIRSGLVQGEGYFNAGVLLIDLDKFRGVDNIMKRSMEFISKYHTEGNDQDALNYFFPHSNVLPEKYNCFVWRGKQEGEPKQGYIYHYVNNAIAMDMEDSFNRLYFRYFVKTPWCNENFIGNLARKIEEVNYMYLNFANLCAGKRRIAIGLADAREVISDMIHLNGEDIYISFEELGNVRLDYSRDKEIFVIFLNGGDYAMVRERLVDFGLAEGVHFFDMFSMLGIINATNKIGYKLFFDC